MYRGIKRGIYPALNILLMLFLPLLIALNYYDVLFGIIGKVFKESSPTTRETISIITTYSVSFVVFLYFGLWLCSETLRIHKSLDVALGGLLGAASGIVMCGVLLIFWFAMPFAEHDFPVDEGQLFFPCHRLTLKAATFVAGAPGLENEKRPFDGIRFMRDVRYGLPSLPSLGQGYYISSIPTGQRVFIELGGGSVPSFLRRIEERLANPDKQLLPSQERQSFRQVRRTPVMVSDASEKAMVAVIMDDVPAEVGVAASDAANIFETDGEVYFAKKSLNDRVFFIKVYEVSRSGVAVATLISLFQPKNAKPEVFEGFLPTKECFQFDDMKLKTALMQDGATPEQANKLMPILRLGGKGRFVVEHRPDSTPYTVEIKAEGKWEIKPVAAPDSATIESQIGTASPY